MGKIIDLPGGGHAFVTDRGVEIPLHPVTQLMMEPLVAELTPPQAPVEDTDIGLVENTTHPDYLEAVERYTLDKKNLIENLYFEFGTDIDIDQGKVDRIKAKYRRLPTKNPLELQSDLLIYVKMVLLSTLEEYNDLLNAIVAEGQPTPGVIAEAREAFRGDLEREADPVG